MGLPLAAKKLHSKKRAKRQGRALPKTKKIAATKNKPQQKNKKKPPTHARQKAPNKSRKARAVKTKAIIKKSIRKAPKPKIIRVKSQKTRSFKDAAKFLKKLGLAFQRTNLRKLKSKPTKTQAKIIKQFQNKDLFLVDKKTAAKYRKIGEPVKGNVLVYEKKKGTRRYAKKDRIVEVQQTAEGKVTREIVPLEYHNLEQWFRDAMKSPSLKKRYGNRVAFRFFGNYTEVIDTVEGALERLFYYQTVQEAIQSGDARYQNMIFKNIELVRVEPGMKGAKRYESAYETYRHKYRKRHRKKERERRWIKRQIMKDKNPGRYAALLEKKREQSKRQYQQRKLNPNWVKKHRAQSKAYNKRRGK